MSEDGTDDSDWIPLLGAGMCMHHDATSCNLMMQVTASAGAISESLLCFKPKILFEPHSEFLINTWPILNFEIPLLCHGRLESGSIWLFHLRSCTACSQTIDTFIAIIGIDRIVAIFSLSTVSKLSVLLQDLIFNGIQISMHINTGDFEGIFAIYSISVSILSFLHYLLQDLIFNGIQIDFVHQQLFWRRRIAIRRIDALQN
jgi:hypothetical protein